MCSANGWLISLRVRAEPPFHGSQCKLANPHSNAVVDLDGDCLAGASVVYCLSSISELNYLCWADVFLVCDDGHGAKYFQIWVNNKDNGFTLSQQGNLPSGVQSITFADIGEYHAKLNLDAV